MIFSHRSSLGRWAVLFAAFAIMAGLLFSRLGRYALWDDEAMVGLVAQGVLKTGDTSVLVDHGNLVAYRGGILVRDFRDRSTPPLATYLTAASFALFGVSAWTARLPFAFFGLATVVLILFWARRASLPVLLVLIIGLLTNVSLILFFRQCRYFAPDTFFTVAVVFVYWRWSPAPRHLLILAVLSILLFVSNYMSYLALYVCLAVDYLIWKRRQWPPTWRNGLLLFGPQIVLNGAVACVWNPFRTAFGHYASTSTLADRVVLFYWNWRDLDGCEFLALPLFILALVMGLTRSQFWLVRGCVALAIYVTFIALISPQLVHLTSAADIRYLSPIIPLCIVVEVGAICLLLRGKPILAVAAAVLVFGTNLFYIDSLSINGFRSTILCYLGELLHPPPEPYTLTAQWINQHVPAGDSIWVLPDYSAYPLMFHAPGALYAWQLEWPPRPDFAGLPPIQFIGRQPPDYLIAFGPLLNEMRQALQSWNRPDVKYQRVAVINVFWRDLYRPELFMRTFKPITNYDPASEAVYIFKRTKPPIGPAGSPSSSP